jgi:hypothetical protein
MQTRSNLYAFDLLSEVEKKAATKVAAFLFPVRPGIG